MAAAAGDDPARQLAPFFARAEEISSIDPRVAYYLRLYAWKRGQVRRVGMHVSTRREIICESSQGGDNCRHNCFSLRNEQAVPNRTDKLNGILDALATTLERDKPRAGLQV